MKIHDKILGFLSVSFVLLMAGLSQAQTATILGDEPLCQVTLSNGNTQDLSAMCGQSSQNVSLPPIDLSAPSPVVMVGKKRPSKLWDTLPNLDMPVEAGQTEPSPPSNDRTPVKASDPQH